MFHVAASDCSYLATPNCGAVTARKNRDGTAKPIPMNMKGRSCISSEMEMLHIKPPSAGPIARTRDADACEAPFTEPRSF